MVRNLLASAGVASSGWVKTAVGIVGWGLVALLAVALVGMLLLAVIAFSISHLGGDAAPRTRRWLARITLLLGGKSLHQSAADPRQDDVSSGFAAIRARDPLFDPAGVIAAARRALFFVFVMQSTGECDRLEQVTTGEFWNSTIGINVRRLGANRAEELAFREGASDQATQVRPGADDEDRVGRLARIGMAVPCDFHIGPTTVLDVGPDQGGMDRVILRVSYVGREVIMGARADRQVVAQNQHLGDRGTPSGGLAQSEQRGLYDWEFVRPSTAKTDTETDDLRCRGCGAPFQSDLDTSCRNCLKARISPEGDWLLARTWQVI